ncbi:MAG: hypothetical protein Q8R11_00955 [bacterium]|nr:hypothetical protein [bacterium]
MQDGYGKNDMMPEDIPPAPPLPEDPWKNHSEKSRAALDATLETLPPDLREATNAFFLDVARTISSQEGNATGEVRVSSDRVLFYQDQFREIIDSGLINPRLSRPKKII